MPGLKEKQRCYFIAAPVALIMALSGLESVYTVFTEGFDIEWANRSTRLNSFATVFFLQFLWMDIFYGYVMQQYPNYLQLLTGWVHHFMYFALMVQVVRYDFCNAFMLCGIEELPTLLFGLGHLSDGWRNDGAFGFTFFVTRICWHAFLLYSFVRTHAESRNMIWHFYLPPMLLHFHWFYGFIKQQLKVNKKLVTAGVNKAK